MRPPLLDDVSAPENGLCHPPAQWKEGTLLLRRRLALCLRVAQVLVWSAAIPDERAVGQA